jgi:hypothetical protein
VVFVFGATSCCGLPGISRPRFPAPAPTCFVLGVWHWITWCMAGTIGRCIESNYCVCVSRSVDTEVGQVPDVRQIGDRCRDFVMALTPHPTTRVHKCRAASYCSAKPSRYPDVRAGAGTLRHYREQVNDSKFADFDQGMLREACDDPRKGTLGRPSLPSGQRSVGSVPC